jgi:hypothetical protein
VNGWPSGGVFSNEGGIVLGGHGMNKDTAMRNMARLNQLWDGKIGATDRVTSAGLRRHHGAIDHEFASAGTHATGIL